MHEVIRITRKRGCSRASLTMLSDSGFNRDDEWGFRAIEPSRCCISSIALVLLKTGIVHHPPAASGERPVTIDYNQMATAQKLLLFWRKPAASLSHFDLLYFSLMLLSDLAAQVLVGRYGGGFSTTWGTHYAGQAVGAKGLDAGTQLGSCIPFCFSRRNRAC